MSEDFDFEEDKFINIYSDSKIVVQTLEKNYTRNEKFSKYLTLINEKLTTFQFVFFHLSPLNILHLFQNLGSAVCYSKANDQGASFSIKERCFIQKHWQSGEKVDSCPKANSEDSAQS